MPPELSPEAKALLERMSAGPPPTVDRYAAKLQAYASHRKWLAAAWLLGASYGQLAQLHDVTRSTVLQAVHKTINEEVRNSFVRGDLNFSEVVWYHDKFIEHKDLLSLLQPADIVAWLLSNHPYQGD